MDLPVIGAHCALPSCNELDLLPIRCNCEKLFCRKHIIPDSHGCSAAAETSGNDIVTSKRQRCAFQGCAKPSLESAAVMDENAEGSEERTPAICPRCTFAFCASHRYPSSHSCPISESSNKSKKNAAAHALLAKNFPSTNFKSNSTSSGPVANVPLAQPRTKDPAKLAQIRKVQVMKMKLKATPGDPKVKDVPVSERLHVRVTVEGSSDPEKVFWFRKNAVTGRVLDLLATSFDLDISDEALQLAKQSNSGEEHWIAIQLDKPLSDEVEDGEMLHIRPQP